MKYTCHPFIESLVEILQKVCTILLHMSEVTQDNTTQYHLAIVLRLLVLLRQVHRDSILYKEADYHKKLKKLHPEVYDAVLSKNIDLKNSVYMVF